MEVPVLLPKIFNFPLTYKSDTKNKLKPGDIVEVPFGKKEEIGVVWNKIHSTNKAIKLRNINKKIHNFSLNNKLIKFIDWFSLYNLVPKGLVLKMCIGNKINFAKKENLTNFEIDKFDNKFKLNYEQRKAIDNLEKKGDLFNVSVLDGTTGSGKTIVYFERIKAILKKKKQVLILLPEIFLTNQFKERFFEYFNFEPAIWHSKITPKNKRIIWQGILENKIKLIIGARSSLLLPFKNLGIIIVDEEHDPSYKQDEGLIYNARDMAISRASIENIPIHLISSVPSLETFNNIKKNKYNHVQIFKRYNNFSLPKIKIVNLNQKLNKDEFITNDTTDIVNKYLDKNEQVLFFLNRRGYSPFLVCQKCGYKHSCPSCSIFLTYHKTINKMLCHHCGYQTFVKKKCIKDKSDCNFKMYGPGVEKIFEELKKKFPQKKIRVFSSDFLTQKKENKNILLEIQNNKIDILVGTQMISKGYNFKKLNCIVVVDADFSGKGYDLRATEKNIQLYNQLSGRAGRFSNNSTIIYQTLTPSHETLKDILENNPKKFLEDELIIRKKNKLPPFSRLIAILILSKSKNFSFQGAKEIKKKLLNIKDLEVLGPVESPLSKAKKMFRTRLLIRTKKDDLIQKEISKILDSLQISSKIKLIVDVDPINFA